MVIRSFVASFPLVRIWETETLSRASDTWLFRESTITLVSSLLSYAVLSFSFNSEYLFSIKKDMLIFLSFLCRNKAPDIPIMSASNGGTIFTGINNNKEDLFKKYSKLKIIKIA